MTTNKKIVQRVFLIMIVITMIVSFNIYISYAVDSAAGALGACNIVNPSGKSYQYVYFGDTGLTSVNTSDLTTYQIAGPIQFRVLSTTANGTLRASVGGSTCSNAALFMMSEYGLCKHVWDSNGGQTWGNSSIRTWLNGTSSSNVLGDCFTEAEQKAIAYTTTSESSMGLPWYYYGTSNINYCYYNDGKYWWVAGRYNSDMSTSVSRLSNDKLFLLSAEEVTNAGYGFDFTKNYPNGTGYAYKFAGNCICRLGNSGGNTSRWWLRSAGSKNGSDCVAFVSDGSYGDSSRNSSAVRFALNVHLSSIIYASNASTTGASASTFKAIDSIARTSATPASTSGYKLTIQDTSRPAFSVSPSSITATPGSKIAVHYTNAKTGSNEYICGIIKNSDNSECYHGRFAPYGSSSTNITSASGDIIMDLPSLTTGTYKLIMYNETNAGAYKTNEGRCANEITLKIQSSPPAGSGPTISNVYKKGDGSYYRFTATDSTGILMATSSDGNSVFRAINGPSGTYNVPTPSGTTEFRVYNFAGKYTVVNETNNTIMTDSRAPVINSVRYSEGKYIIDVTDSDSGIWKITDSQGNIIADYS